MDATNGFGGRLRRRGRRATRRTTRPGLNIRSWSWTTSSRWSGPPAVSAWSASTCRKNPGAANKAAAQGRVGFNFGAAFEKGIAIGSGQCPVKKYNRYLRDLIIHGRATPSFIVSHEVPLAQAPDAYAKFDARENGYTKVLLKPAA